MRLSPAQVELFQAGCSDPHNDAAQRLLNVFGVEEGCDVLDCITTAPLDLLGELVTYFWHAMDHEAMRRVVLLDAQDGI